MKKIYWLFLLFLVISSCFHQSKIKPNLSEKSSPASQPTETKTDSQKASRPSESSPPLLTKEIIAEELKQQLEDERERQADKPQASLNNEEVSSRLEDILNLCQEAETSWQKGELDEAMSLLDKAYGLLLKVHISTDSPLIQEKNNLRLLIAQKIQQIYASRLIIVGDNHRTIPLEENEEVLAEIRSFQTKERQAFEEAYKRSGFYREIILEEIRKAGLPEEIVWLPLIESFYKVKALSRAQALGLWQFIASTGYRFGLKRDRWVDERMDPIKSTKAAIRYLSELHDLFGDWTTALAAYNCGEIKVQNVIRTQRINYLDNFWDLYRRLPQETARFVPRFIAAVLIIKNPEKYGFNLPEPYPPLKWETVTINRPVKLSALAKALDIDPAELSFLNPELRQDGTPNYPYELKVPLGTANKVLAAIQNLPSWIPPEPVIHIVKPGETLSSIARRYRTSVEALIRLNNLKNPRLIHPGQRIKITG
ncbi:MAG: transglycosylase SLT domain-containing protein [Candidatus Aminicenantes bacterium]|nr:transglycosylase SLT domain-containing protein [Candidatus Aminicenantes bacterium]